MILAGALIAALAGAGCGSGTRTVTVSTPPRTTASTQTGAGTSTGAAGAGAGTTSTASSAAPVVHLSSFQTPSGNIGCMLIGGLARCDIERREWSPPPRPSSCPRVVDFGQGLEIGSSGPADFVCAGDTVRDPAAPRLAYGTDSEYGAFVCASARTGLTCTRRADGHGFFISIQSYRLF